MRLSGESYMGPDASMELMNQLLWNTIIIAAPVLLGALAVGLLVSVIQVTTQLQEMTLSYVPKLAVSALLLLLLGPWMMRRITQFAISMIMTIPQLN